MPKPLPASVTPPRNATPVLAWLKATLALSVMAFAEYVASGTAGPIWLRALPAPIWSHEFVGPRLLGWTVSDGSRIRLLFPLPKPLGLPKL